MPVEVSSGSLVVALILVAIGVAVLAARPLLFRRSAIALGVVDPVEYYKGDLQKMFEEGIAHGELRVHLAAQLMSVRMLRNESTVQRRLTSLDRVAAGVGNVFVLGGVILLLVDAIAN